MTDREIKNLAKAPFIIGKPYSEPEFVEMYRSVVSAAISLAGDSARMEFATQIDAHNRANTKTDDA